MAWRGEAKQSEAMVMRGKQTQCYGKVMVAHGRTGIEQFGAAMVTFGAEQMGTVVLWNRKVMIGKAMALYSKELQRKAKAK